MPPVKKIKGASMVSVVKFILERSDTVKIKSSKLSLPIIAAVDTHKKNRYICINRH